MKIPKVKIIVGINVDKITAEANRRGLIYFEDNKKTRDEFMHWMKEDIKETKTTARKATGSYYTPREIVNFIVDESLKQYLLSKLTGFKEKQLSLDESNPEPIGDIFGGKEDEQLKIPDKKSELDEKEKEKIKTSLDILFSYSDESNPFDEIETGILIYEIDKCKILEPARGSGAFPMGILNQLVHILKKLDPQNHQ